jgi:hypothetical protein
LSGIDLQTGTTLDFRLKCSYLAGAGAEACGTVEEEVTHAGGYGVVQFWTFQNFV